MYGRKEPANLLHFVPEEFVTLFEPVVDANIRHGSLSGIIMERRKKSTACWGRRADRAREALIC